MPARQYTYFDICKALFGTNTDAFGIEAIHDFIVKGLKSRKPYCLYYGDFAIEISRSFESVIESLRREFDKTYIEVNQAYDIANIVAKSNAGLYTSIIDNIVKSGDKDSLLTIVTTKRGIDTRQSFIKADFLPGFIVSGYSKMHQSGKKTSQAQENGLQSVDEPIVLEIDIAHIKQLMQEKCFTEKDSIYEEYIKRCLGSVVKQDTFFTKGWLYVDSRRDCVVIKSGDQRENKLCLDRLVTRLLNRVYENYMSCESIYEKMQTLPVFAKRFSFNEVVSTLSNSSAFKHEGFLGQREMDGKKIYTLYLKKTEFEAFLEDEYPELYEQYTWRKDPWLSIGDLTRMSKMSDFTIIDVLTDMASKDAYAHFIRYESRAGDMKPFLKREAVDVFLEYAKVYKAEKKKAQDRKNFIKQYWWSAEQVAKRLDMPLDVVCDVLSEMSKNIIYVIMVKFLEENGEKVPYLDPSSINSFKDYIKYHYNNNSVESVTKSAEPVVEKPAVVPEQKPVQAPVVPRAPQMPRRTKSEKPVYTVSANVRESFYVNGSAHDVYLPDVHILSQDMYSASLYVRIEELEVLGRANALANSTLYDENGVPKYSSPKVTSVKGIIKTYLKNVKNYYKEKAGQMTEAREKIFFKCIMSGVDTLDKESDFIKQNFNVDVRPLVAKYRKGEFPSLQEVISTFLGTEFNLFCVKQLEISGR